MPEYGDGEMGVRARAVGDRAAEGLVGNARCAVGHRVVWTGVLAVVEDGGGVHLIVAHADRLAPFAR